MSRPARAWSETTTAWASVNCSRNQGSIMAVSRGRPQVFILYQRGRGQEPVTVAGSIKFFVAVKAIAFPLLAAELLPLDAVESRDAARRQDQSVCADRAAEIAPGRVD